MTGHLVSLVALFVASLGACVVPGPNNFMLMRFGMKHGRAIAMASGFGTTLSCVVWCALAALGLAAVLAAAPWLYKVLRVGGGLYLLWFAWMLWRGPEAAAAPEAEAGTATLSWWNAFWQGFAVNMTNPKSVLYFASIFSAYVGPATPAWVKIGAVVIAISTCQLWQALMSWLFSTRRAADAYARAQQPLDRAAGVVMGGFGLSLLWVFD